jgi:hypothetical protein
VNGALENSITVGRPTRSDSIQHAALGTAMTSTGVAAGFFAGTLDEARIWNVARTGPQILSGRDQQISTATGLVGRWGFDTECGQVMDSAGGDQNGTLFGTSWAWVTPGAPFSGTPNTAPVTNAGLDLAVTLPATASLGGTVTDDGLPECDGDDRVEQGQRPWHGDVR